MYRGKKVQRGHQDLDRTIEVAIAIEANVNFQAASTSNFKFKTVLAS